MTPDVPTSVRMFATSLTAEGDDNLDLETVEAAYIVYCEAVEFRPVDLVDVRCLLEQTGIETTPEKVLNRSWDGLEAFVAENRDAVRRVANGYQPRNPVRAVPARERHIHAVAEKWATPLQQGADVGEVSLR